jgi:predicted amidohydrolase
MIRIACCQYQIEELSDWQSYVAKIEKLVASAKNEDAKILLLPEYAGVEIAGNQFKNDHELFTAMQPFIPKYLKLFADLAQEFRIYIQPGTVIEEIVPNEFINRAYFFSPKGLYGYQDKLQLTEEEKSLKILSYGTKQSIFKTPLGMIGIAICYDVEFPEIVRRLTFAGAQIILVPSFTLSLAGYHRVYLSCRARAIENQCYVAVSFVVSANWNGDGDNGFGRAAILSPVDTGFNDDGVVACGRLNEEELVIGDISLKKIAIVRRKGQVLNFIDARRYDLIVNRELEEILFT